MFFGVDFGIRTGHSCTTCGDEFLTEETWDEVERKAKELKIFGLERKVRIRKSGNSLVITLPPEVAAYIGARSDVLVSLVPTGTLERAEFKARRVIDDRDLLRAVRG
jgi:antitoxin component of MazEF toxin-antitoxin module